jgi:uncharacterized protein YhaN
MRFNRLDILRYGALTDRRLEFRPDARLHVVYGPNEAGKSSALSAISDLLFGFPDRAAYSFLHDPATLRVGAELEGRDGRTLSFRRRRGRKSTLLAAEEAETALPEDTLVPFLGTLSRDVFTRAFGLDSISLRAGGDAMLKSGGEIGSLLFSAASGLTGLSDLRKTIEAEADGIFGQRRSKDRAFYQVLDAHDEARRAERESELKSGDWKKLVAEQAEIERDLAAVQAERQQTKHRLEDLRRLSRLEPVLREIDRERQQLLDHEDLRKLPAGFAAKLEATLEAQGRSADARQVAEREAAHMADEMAAVHVDDGLVAMAPRVLAAYAQKGAYVRAKEDLSRVRHEVDGFDLRLTQAAKRLGLAGLQDLERAQPTDSELARLRRLVDDGSTVDQDLAKLRQQIEDARTVLRRLADAAPQSRLVDPRPSAEHFAALRPELGELSKIDTMEVRLARARSDLDAAAGRLDPPVREIERLLSVPLPDIAVLTQHRRLVETARAEHVQASKALAGLRDELRSVASQMVALEQQGRLASPQEIAAARSRRDDLIEQLAREPKKSPLDDVKTAVAEADQLADAALADAERVSRHAQLSLRQKELQQALAEAERVEREAGIAASDAVTEFEDLFYAAPVVPAAPERMIEWRRAVDELSRLSELVNNVDDELATLRRHEARLKPALETLADAIGFSAGSLPVMALARGIERRIDELAERWSETRSAEAKRQVAEDAIERLEGQETDLVRKADAWRVEFAAAVLPLGLTEEADIGMAVAALEVWRSVPDLFAERENRDRRVRGMTRDMDDFEEEIRQLCHKVAPDLVDLPADAAADMLNTRASEAKAAANQKATLSIGLERARLSLARHAQEGEARSAELIQMASEAGRPVDDVAKLLADLRERARLEASLDHCRSRFGEQAQGLSEVEARQALEGFDRVAADLEIERLDAEDHRQVERLKSLGIAQADNDRRRRDLEGGIGAERAVYQRLAAEEEAKTLARRWVVLKLAGALLGNSMEAYRERQADPVMQRAGGIFSELTGGRFSRLLQVYDEKDELRLAVERNSGEQVALSGLSEGTGDQLYLALRLSFLEDYCSRNEPAPLVLDDIFQTFDDERTAAGIRVLADAGSRFQTILFTHQMSLVQAARSELGDGLDLVMLDRA